MAPSNATMALAFDFIGSPFWFVQVGFVQVGYDSMATGLGQVARSITIFLSERNLCNRGTQSIFFFLLWFAASLLENQLATQGRFKTTQKTFRFQRASHSQLLHNKELTKYTPKIYTFPY
jgi:hypothetical protein